MPLQAVRQPISRTEVASEGRLPKVRLRRCQPPPASPVLPPLHAKWPYAEQRALAPEARTWLWVQDASRQQYWRGQQPVLEPYEAATDRPPNLAGHESPKVRSHDKPGTLSSPRTAAPELGPASRFARPAHPRTMDSGRGDSVDPGTCLVTRCREPSVRNRGYSTNLEPA